MSFAYEAPSAQRDLEDRTHSTRERTPAREPAWPLGGIPHGAIGNSILRHSSASGVRAQLMRRTQQHVGNRAAQKMVAGAERSPVDEVHTPVAAGMPSSTIATSRELYFASGQYSPDTAANRRLTVNQPRDEYERHADHAASRVMRTPQPGIQRQCACGGTCSKCQSNGSGEGQSEAPPIVHEVLRSSGQPLDSSTREFMEPRFGYDFSGVRVHTDGLAARSAEAVSAEAYTVGSDVVFGANRYAPASSDGRHLLAHELAHVTQQGSEVRRMTFGSGTAPEDTQEAPQKERARVLAAIARIRKIVTDPKGYANCHKLFAETCPGGNASSLQRAFDTAVLWRFLNGRRPGVGAATACDGEDCHIVAYTDTGYNEGEASLAYDLLHELGHVCGISPDPPHYMADKLALYCMGPKQADENNQVTVGIGRSTEDWALILSYGWLFSEWRAGRLSLHMDVDFNVIGALRTSDPKTAGEIGGAALSLRGRPFSGEHFGGLSFHGGVGGEFGRFRVRPPAASDPPDIRYAAALVIEAGSRIEWWVKDPNAIDATGQEGRVRPRGIDFSYRLIQPVTPGAQRAHEFLASYLFYF